MMSRAQARAAFTRHGVIASSVTFHGRIFVVIGCAPLRGRQGKCGGRKERIPEGCEPRRALPDQIVTDDISRAPVAQLDRVSGYEPEGREFESLRARQTQQRVAFTRRSTSIRM
jgi:hypothetical protein